MVAVTYYNGFRIIIPMNEMMINLSGDGRENADTLNRQVRIANNMLGCDIDFIIKDLDTKSRSVVASTKGCHAPKKRQTFYIGEEGEKPLLYPGRIAEARVIAVAPKAVRLEVFGVEVSVRARDMAWEWMRDAGEKFQVGDLVQVMVNKVEVDQVDRTIQRGSGCQKPDGQYQQGQSCGNATVRASTQVSSQKFIKEPIFLCAWISELMQWHIRCNMTTLPWKGRQDRACGDQYQRQL